MKHSIKYVGIGCAVLLFSAALTVGALLLVKGTALPTNSQEQRDDGAAVDPEESRRQADAYIAENKFAEAIQKLQEAHVVYVQRNDRANADQLAAEIERLRTVQSGTTTAEPEAADSSVFDPSRTNGQ